MPAPIVDVLTFVAWILIVWGALIVGGFALVCWLVRGVLRRVDANTAAIYAIAKAFADYTIEVRSYQEQERERAALIDEMASADRERRQREMLEQGLKRKRRRPSRMPEQPGTLEAADDISARRLPDAADVDETGRG